MLALRSLFGAQGFKGLRGSLFFVDASFPSASFQGLEFTEPRKGKLKGGPPKGRFWGFGWCRFWCVEAYRLQASPLGCLGGFWRLSVTPSPL